MKYIFLVHSNITLVMAKAVIESELLQPSKVLILLTRGMQSSLKYESIDADVFFKNLENIAFKNFHKGWGQIDLIDNFLDEKINNKFVIYLPNIKHPFFQILATNKNCVGVNIVEEGAVCLAKNIFNNGSSLKFSLINMLFNRTGLYGKKRYFRTRSLIDFPVIGVKQKPTFYAITPNAFSEIKEYEKKILSFDKSGFISDEKYIDDNSTVFVFEAIVEQGNLERDLFFESIHLISNEYAGKSAYVKFHPAQNQDNISAICEILNAKMEIVILPNNVVLELEFLRCKNLNVCGFVSSLLLYADLFGHNVTTYSALWENDKRFIRFRTLCDYPLPANK